MKLLGILGIVLIIIGGLAFLIGLLVCVNTWTSDYASSTCEKAEHDKKAFAEAKERCGSTTSDCYRQETIGLTSDDDCEYKKSYMNRQLIMGIVPAVIGALAAIVGLVMAIGGFFLGRKKAVT